MDARPTCDCCGRAFGPNLVGSFAVTRKRLDRDGEGFAFVVSDIARLCSTECFLRHYQAPALQPVEAI